MWNAAINDGDINALRFVLERMGRERGWGHHVEVSGQVEWAPPKETLAEFHG
jgi:hypothetical protein